MLEKAPEKPMMKKETGLTNAKNDDGVGIDEEDDGGEQ